MKRKPIPQFDLPGTEQVFNLASETALDGERLAREQQAEAERQAQVRQLQDKQQPSLI
jgi:hypothetical protein